MDFDHKHKLLALGFSEGIVILIGRPGMRRILKCREDLDYRLEAAVQDVHFIQFSTKLITISADSRIRIWNWISGSMESCFHFSKESQGLCISSSWIMPSLEYRFLFIGTTSGLIRVFDSTHGQLSKQKLGSVKDAEVRKIEGCPTENKFLLVAYADGRLTLWNVIQDSVEADFSQETNNDTIGDIAWNENGEIFAVGWSSGLISIHKRKNLEQFVSLSSNAESIPIERLLWIVAPDEIEYPLGILLVSVGGKYICAVDPSSQKMIESFDLVDIYPGAAEGCTHMLSTILVGQYGESDQKNDLEARRPWPYLIQSDTSRVLISHPSFSGVSVDIFQRDLCEQTKFIEIFCSDAQDNAAVSKFLASISNNQTIVHSELNLYSQSVRQSIHIFY